MSDRNGLPVIQDAPGGDAGACPSRREFLRNAAAAWSSPPWRVRPTRWSRS